MTTTTERGLFERIKNEVMRPERGGTWHICFHSMREICAEHEQQLAAAREEVEGLRVVAVSAQTLYSDSEEYEFDDGMGRGCGQIYWDDLGDSLEALSAPQSRLDNEDWWLSLAGRHANQDWNSENPDGYLNAVKALVRDALTAPLLEKNDHE